MYESIFNIRGDVIGRDVINGYTVDTCYTADAGYETAILYRTGEIVVVEKYVTAQLARVGHDTWCELCKESPKNVHSIQYDVDIPLRD